MFIEFAQDFLLNVTGFQMIPIECQGVPIGSQRALNELQRIPKAVQRIFDDISKCVTRFPFTKKSKFIPKGLNCIVIEISFNPKDSQLHFKFSM